MSGDSVPRLGAAGRRSPTNPPLRIAFVGWGTIVTRTAQLLNKRGSNIEMIGVGTRTTPTGETALPSGVRWLSDPAALADLGVDMVIEAAGRAAVEPWGLAALQYARSFVVSSTSAFCEEGVLEKLVASADLHGSQILVSPGALAGIDALAAASVLELHEVTHRIVKPPIAWLGTPAENLLRLDAMKHAEIFFEGSAREAARQFPANANVAVIAALAGLGLDATKVQLVADPDIQGNGHQLHVEGAFGTLKMEIENRALAANPKSSELTALALVRIIENRTAPLSL